MSTKATAFHFVMLVGHLAIGTAFLAQDNPVGLINAAFVIYHICRLEMAT